VVNDLGPQSVDQEDGASDPAVIETIRRNGGKAEVIYADLSVKDSSRELAREAVRRFGKVDIFIHNAGTATGTLDQHLDLHLKGAVWVMHELWPGMVEWEFGRVLITVSGVGMYGSGAECARGMTAQPGSARTGCTGVAKAAAYGLTRHSANRRGRQYQRQCDRPDRLHRGREAGHDGTGRRPHRAAPVDPEKCTPERAAPVAAYLVHEDCAVTGEVWRAAEAVARIFVAETPGYRADDLQLEDVQEHIDQIRDEKDYTVPASSGVG
jgi:NAD(P)-dependent dehydrogenase (short-subunit alcohol dehydrogenase family)